MRRSLDVLVVVLAALSLQAEAYPESHTSARSRIDRLITTTWTLAMRGTLPPEVPGLTTQVNAILALPEEEVIEALRDAVRIAEERHHPASSLVKSLAMILADAKAVGEGGWWMGSIFGEFKGALVVRSVVLPRMQRNAREYRVRIPEAARVREPFTVDPHAILTAVLAGDPTVTEITGAHPGSLIVSSLAAPIGLAARTDRVLAEQLLRGVGGLLDRDAPDVAETVCLAAVGFLGSDRAREILLASLANHASAKWGSPAGVRCCNLLLALRQAEATEHALRVLVEHGAGLEPEDLRHRCTLLGGDAAVRPWLSRARSEPTVEALEGLAQILNEGHNPSISLDKRIAAAGLARDLLTAPESELRRVAQAVLQTALWAGLYGKYGYCECPNTPADIGDGHPKAARSAEYFRGGWPDPLGQLARLEEDLAADRLLVDVKLIPWASVFEEPGRGVTLSARREGSELRVRITNRGSSPVAFNPLVFRYGTAVCWPLAGHPGGRCEIRLAIGRILPHHRCRVPAAVLHTIPAGESYEGRYPLPDDLHPSSRILVTLMDDFLIDGDAGLPVVRLLDEVQAD